MFSYSYTQNISSIVESSVTVYNRAVSTGDIVQIIIAAFMLAGVVAAFLTALLNWRSSPILLATKEKHSKDLMELLENWRNQIIAQGLPTYNPPTGEEQSFPIEQHILFDDLKNHVPRELDISKLWNEFKLMRNELDARINNYYDHIKVHLEQYSRLKVLSYKDESKEQAIGITHQCQDWFYKNLLRKAEDKDIRLKLRLSIPDHAPSELRGSPGDTWAWTNSQTEAQWIMSLVQEMVDNINSGQSDTAEWNLVSEGEGVISTRNKLQEQRDMILDRIAEIKAIPILTGECKHLKRAIEPLFLARSGRKEHNRLDKGPHYVSESRRFFETTSIAVVFLSFSVVTVSIVDFSNIVTFKMILFLALSIVTFVLFIVFSVGLIWSRVTDWYGRVFERRRSWKSTIFISIFWPAIVIGFLIALFSRPLPEFLFLPAAILATVWGIYVIIALFWTQHLSHKRKST